MTNEDIANFIVKHRDSIDDSKRLHGLLADFMPDNKALQRVLLIMHEEGIVTHYADEDLNAVINKYSRLLIDEYAINKEQAYAAIEIWTRILGIFEEGIFENTTDAMVQEPDNTGRYYYVNLVDKSARIIQEPIVGYFDLLSRIFGEKTLITYRSIIDYYGIYFRRIFDSVLETLTEREQGVLRSRYGLDDGVRKSLEDVGKDYMVTGERIRQIEEKALRKLRHPARSRRLKIALYDKSSGTDKRNTLVDYGKHFETILKEEMACYGQGEVEIEEMLFSNLLLAISSNGIAEDADIIGKPIEELKLSVRSFNCLKRAGVSTVGDMIKLSYDDLLKVRNLGRKSLEEVVDVKNKIDRRYNLAKRDGVGSTNDDIKHEMPGENNQAVLDGNAIFSKQGETLITRTMLKPKDMIAILQEGFLYVSDFLKYYDEKLSGRNNETESIEDTDIIIDESDDTEIFNNVIKKDEIEILKVLLRDNVPVLRVNIPQYVKNEMNQIRITTLGDLEKKKGSMSVRSKQEVELILQKVEDANKWLEEEEVEDNW